MPSTTLSTDAQSLHALSDNLYPSKDWQQGTQAERVEWLHIMFESKKAELEEFHKQYPGIC